ncbi:MAG: M48 family metallopeptidase [Bacteroidales bacterium]|nr:M48 family metallopeptidase [Bacteroidales bacterium]
MHTVLFYIILLIIVCDFIGDQWLGMLNLRALSTGIPPELRHVYNAEEYARSQEYTRIRTRFSQTESVLVFVLMVCMLCFNGFAWLNDLVCRWSGNDIVRCLLFFGALDLLFNIISLPFEIYSVFVIEAEFGFNRTSPRTFAADKIKNMLLEWLFGGLLLGLVTWFYGLTERFFWIYALAGITLFELFMTVFYTSLIVPLFNKLEPLPDGPVKEAVSDFARRTGFDFQSLKVIDGSKRSSKGNAFFSGLGKRKSIVLYDTLINDLDVPHIIAVLGHEIGHYRMKHIRKNFIMACISNALMLFLLSLCLKSPAFSQALNVNEPNFHIGLLSFGLLYSPVSTITGLFSNILSRRAEFQADAFAAEACGNSDDLKDALCRLSAQSLTNLTPHPLYVFINYSHPTLLQRVQALQNAKARESQ